MISISDFVHLQPITINDHLELVSLMKRIYPSAYKQMWKNEDCSFYFEHFYNLDNLRKELEETESEYYFIYYNANLVGILRVHYDKPMKTKPGLSGCYLNRIYLGEEAQGKGIAKELMTWVEQKARLRGNKVIWLEAMDTQDQALKFYKKHGFKKSHKAYLDFAPLRDAYRGMEVFYKLLN